MAEIFIPFEQGQSEAADPKLLPQGLFLSAQNVRYTKDGRLAVRNAYRNDTTIAATTAATLGAGSFGVKSDVFIKPRTLTNGVASARNVVNGVLSANALNIHAADMSPVEAVYVDRNSAAPQAISAIDTVYFSDTRLIVAYAGYDSVAKTQKNPSNGVAPICILIFNALTGQPSGSQGVQLLSPSDASNVKLVLTNGVLCVFTASPSANTINMTGYNPSTLSVVTANVVVATATAGRAQYFDVSTGGASTETYLVYPSAASTLSFGTVTSAGVYAQLNTIATTNAEPRPSICATGLNPTDQIAIVWNDGATFTTGNCKYTVYRRSTTSFIVATTTAYSSGDCTGYPVVAAVPSSVDGSIDWVAAFNITGSAITVARRALSFDSTGVLKMARGELQISSKPFIAGKFCGVACTDVDSMSVASGGYYIVDAASGSSTTVAASFSPLRAQPSDVSTVLCDPRRNAATGLTATGREPNLLALNLALPISTTNNTGWTLFHAEYGARSEKYVAAKLNGYLFFSGAVVQAFDGATLTEMGQSLPASPTLSSMVAGTIPAGTYQFLILWEWTDIEGRIWRSAPSLPLTVTSTAPGSFRLSTLSTIPNTTLRSFSSFLTAIRMRIYRTTLATPTIFRDALGATTSPTGGVAGVGLTDVTLTDAQIATNEILYTQGARGGLSGLLQNDRPPGARYIWAGVDRLIIGGMEDPTEVWWSKLRVPGEPMNFTNNATYKANVEGRVTAVAEMDGTWFIATATNWWQVTGSGPDDTGANGSFGSPLRLPSDVGCISQKSVVVTNQGLLFQGRQDAFFLLPRGGGGPTPIGWQVRDTLTSFPFVAASAYNQQKNVVYWAVINSTDTAGRLIVYDARLNIWYVDNFLSRAISSLTIYDNLLHIDGSVLETVGNYQDTDSVTPTSVLPSLTTGDLRPFGLAGRGRVRKVTLLGEARDVATAFTPTLAISYDSGKTFGESVSWPIASLATNIGDTIEAEHCLAQPKGDAFRFQLSWSTPAATEGIVWNGLSLEAYPERGLTRLNDAKRA